METSSSRLLSSKNFNWNYGNLKKFLTYFLKVSPHLKKEGLLLKMKDKRCEPLKSSDITKKINEKEEKMSQNKDIGELNRTKKKKQPRWIIRGVGWIVGRKVKKGKVEGKP